MKQLSWRFVFSNILAAVFLVVFAPSWKKLSEDMTVDGSDPLYGWIIFLVTIVGIIASALKAYDLAFHARVKLKVLQKIFLVFLYLVSMFGAVIMVTIASRMIQPWDVMRNGGFVFLILLIIVAMFVLLVLESHFLDDRPKKPLSKPSLQFANIGSMMYSGFGISICWNAIVIGGQIYFPYNLLGFVQLVLTMLIMVFPFQRLFWYEMFSHADSKLDHFKVVGAIALTLLSGILPYYFIDRGI